LKIVLEEGNEFEASKPGKEMNQGSRTGRWF
jgi:hypothetical protein